MPFKINFNWHKARVKSIRLCKFFFIGCSRYW